MGRGELYWSTEPSLNAVYTYSGRTYAAGRLVCPPSWEFELSDATRYEIYYAPTCLNRANLDTYGVDLFGLRGYYSSSSSQSDWNTFSQFVAQAANKANIFSNVSTTIYTNASGFPMTQIYVLTSKGSGRYCTIISWDNWNPCRLVAVRGAVVRTSGNATVTFGWVGAVTNNMSGSEIGGGRYPSYDPAYLFCANSSYQQYCNYAKYRYMFSGHFYRDSNSNNPTFSALEIAYASFKKINGEVDRYYLMRT